MSSRKELSKSKQATEISAEKVPDELLVQMYKTMLLARILDAKILSLQRQGRVGPYVPGAGEEAAVVGAASALLKTDWLFPSYRELGAQLTKGISIDHIIAQLYGNRNDLLKGRQMSNSWGDRTLNIVPTAAPIGAYLPVAVGLSLGAKIRKESTVVLTFLGDGGTSSSDFHSAMNFAGVFKTATVFVCRNNGWAISLPVAKQTAAKSLAVKASAYGFEGIQVNGNDAIEVYLAAKKAVDKARAGGGPTFIEALTYRLGPHSTADDPTRYRTAQEVEAWKRKDPLEVMRSHLVSRRLWNEDDQSALVSEYENLIAESVARQEKTGILPETTLFFDDVYAKKPWFLKEEEQEVSDLFEGRKKD